MSNNYDKLEKEEQELEESILIRDLQHGYKKELELVAKSYKRVVEIVSQFLKQFPTVEDKLNDEYINLFVVVEKNFNFIKKDIEKRLDNDKLPNFYTPGVFLENIIYKPFDNLYTAETDLRILNAKLQEDEFRLIRKRMNKCYGDIRAFMMGVKLNTYSKAIGGEYTGFLTKDYRWSDNRMDYLIGNERLPFGAKKSIRKTVFEMLVEKDGGFVLAIEIAGKIGKDKSYVKTVVSQLNDKLRSHELITKLKIVARGNFPEPSAYKLVPNSKN